MRGLSATAGGTVIVSGPMLRTLHQVVCIAVRARQRNGLPISAHHTALLKAVASAIGQSDIPDSAGVHSFPRELPTVTVAEAAARLRVSERTVRRLAPLLGGQRIGGRWLVDDQALREHMEGRQQWTDSKC